MIHESVHWKERLAKDAEIIDRWAAKAKVTDRRSVLIEQKVFLAAYTMRKLAEGGKLSSSFEELSIQCLVCAVADGQLVTSLNNHRINKLYDLATPSRCTTKIQDLLNLIVHSLVFGELLREDDTIESFFVTSDRKWSNLWFVNMDNFTSTMRHVAQDYPSSEVRAFDPKKKNWIIWRGDGEPPTHIQRKIEKAMEAWHK